MTTDQHLPEGHEPHCRARLDATPPLIDRSCRACREAALGLSLAGARYETVPVPKGRGRT